MTIEIPTYQEEYNKALNEVQLQVNTNETNPDNFLNAQEDNFVKSIVASLALPIIEWYLTSQKNYDNLFINTANEEYTLIHAINNGIIRKVATQSSGVVAFSGTAGGIIPSSTVLSTASGLEYETQSQLTITSQTINISTLSRSGFIVTATTASSHNLATGLTLTVSGANETDYNGSFEITVINGTQFTYEISTTPTTPATGSIQVNLDYGIVNVVASDYGSDYNLNGGSVVSLSSSIVDIDDNARVLYDGITGGIDAETVEELRARVIDKLRNNTTGFSVSGIKNFIKNNFLTVTRVWVIGANSNTLTENVSSLSSDANGHATLTPATTIPFLDGSTITVSGANESILNVSARAIQDSSNNLVYALGSASSVTGTGTITFSYTDVEGGKTRIYFTTDNEANIIPTPTILSEVKNAIIGNTVGIEGILPAEMPEGNCYVLAPLSTLVNITFSSLSPNTVEMQQAITSSLENFFTSDLVNINEDVLLDSIKVTIANTVDLNGNIPVFTLSDPSADISISNGYLGIIGTITYP